jgi:hypothetical protein
MADTRWFRIVMIIVTVVIILGLIGSTIAAPAAL